MVLSIYITFPTENVARKMTNHLLQKRLVACGNIFKVESRYWWKDVIQDDKEWAALYKTSAGCWDALVQEVEHVHPYDVPCVIRYEVQANPSYEKWVESEVIEPS